ncbi:hypothetical protein OSTOST_20433 [Ostertagia ostertagi]
MYWLLAVPAGAVALYGCGKKRGAAGKSGKSSRSGGSKSGRSKRHKGKSSRSSRSKSRRSKGSRSRKSRRGRSKSSKSGRSRKSRRSKSKRSKSRRAAKPSELRVEPCELSYKAIGGLKGVNVVNDTQERKFFKASGGYVARGWEAHRLTCIYDASQAELASDTTCVMAALNCGWHAEDGETPSREVFNQGRSTEMMVLPLLVQE